MKGEKSCAGSLLEDATGLVDYEIMISREGISEPDSDFIWASNFRAPIGISFTPENVYFNLFLPESSENDSDKKLFLKRVNAKLQDGLWQVRRSQDQVVANYGPTIMLAVSAFKSLILDYSFIDKGRVYVHFVFNEADLEGISRMLMSMHNALAGLRVEYLKKIDGLNPLFQMLGNSNDVAAVTLEAVYNEGNVHSDNDQNPVSFMLGGIFDSGVKCLASASSKGSLDLLSTQQTVEVSDGVISCYSDNPFINDLAGSIAKNYIVAYGMYGVSAGNSITIALNVPREQTGTLLGILSQLVEKESYPVIRLREMIDFRDILQ